MMAWWNGRGLAAPAHLDAELESAVAERQFREGRFLLLMGMTIGIISLVVDAITQPQNFAEIALVRLLAIVPLQLAGLAMPRHRQGWQKFLIGLSLVAFCLSLVHASSLAPPPADAFLALGVVMMMGMAAPLLPFSGRGIALFLLGVIAPATALLWFLGSELEFARTFVAILVLVAGGAGIISRRMRWLERRTALLTLQAEERARELEQSNARLTELSMQDPLTNLANRRWAETAFKRDYALSADEAPGHTALLLMDLDHFKLFNDRWGHDAGDRCLQAVAEVMRHAAGTHGGLAARFGGEEFVVIMRAQEPSTAIALAEELRLGVERIEMDHEQTKSRVSCTTSIGIAVHESDGKPSLSQLLKRADEALYRAKREGRNRHRLAA